MSNSQAIEDYAKAVYALGLDRDGRVPSGEVATRLGVAPATATAMLQKLAELGLAEYVPYKGVSLTPAGEKVALEVIRQPEDSVAAPRARANDNVVPLRRPASPPRLQVANDVVELPLHGRIAAGVPIEALEGQSTLPVPAALLGPGEHYALEVSGDSMIDAGIFDGDFALVRKTDVARDGEIVVALVRDEEATLKYLRREDGMVRLDPANGAYEPQIYRPNEVKVQGKLAGLLRRYH